MKLVEQLGQSGDLLFRWRSWLPLLLLPLFVASDPVWTMVAVAGGAFFVVMRIRKKGRAASRG